MPVRDDENMLNRLDEKDLDDFLAQDRRRVKQAANERIAGGLYARIARAHAEHSSEPGWKWQIQLCVAAGLAAAVALALIWIALPHKSSSPTPTQSAQLFPSTTDAHVVVVPPTNKSPVRGPRRASPRPRTVARLQAVPRQATFPINVTATEQERLLGQLAAQHPKELIAMAEAMAASKARAEAESQEFDQWLQQRGANQ